MGLADGHFRKETVSLLVLPAIEKHFDVVKKALGVRKWDLGSSSTTISPHECRQVMSSLWDEPLYI